MKAGGAIRVVIVGFGRMGRLHARTLARLAEFQLVAVIDPDPGCAAAAEALGLCCLGSIAALEAGAATLAIVAVPSSRHKDVVLALAARGIHCLVEKPVGMDAAEVEAMHHAAAAAGVRAFAGFSERFNPVIGSLCDKVLRPEAITVRRVSSHALHRDFDTDVVLDLLSHDVDWVSMLLGGLPEAVESVDGRAYRGRLEEVRCRLRYATGVRVELTASRIAPDCERTVTLLERCGKRHHVRLDERRGGISDDALTAQARAVSAALRGEPTMLAELGDAIGVHRELSRLAQMPVTVEHIPEACDAM